MYLEARHADGDSESTIQSHGYRLGAFVEWCDENGIGNMNDVTGRDLHEFKVHRRDEDGLKPITLQGQLSTLRVFLDFCASVEGVPSDLSDKIILPTMSRDQETSEVTIERDRAEEVREYLKTYEYASREHAIFELMWHVGLRLGGIRSIDLDEVFLDEGYIELYHRPDDDTPLKNGYDGERPVSVSNGVCQVLGDYIEVNRVDNTDENGREPLFTTTHGRVSRNTIRDVAYRVTRPCLFRDCPHDREPESCEAMEEPNKCPSSVSPHPVRRGSITHQMSSDATVHEVSERVNSSPKILKKHYDERAEYDKMEQRRDKFDKL